MQTKFLSENLSVFLSTAFGNRYFCRDIKRTSTNSEESTADFEKNMPQRQRNQ